jgi:hypothetical protein
VNSLSSGCLQQTISACRTNSQLCYCSFDTASTSPTDIFKLANDASSKCTTARLQEPGVPTCIRSVVTTLNQCSSGGQNAMYTCTQSGNTQNVMALAQCMMLIAPTLQPACIPALVTMFGALTQAVQAAPSYAPNPTNPWPGWSSVAPATAAWSVPPRAQGSGNRPGNRQPSVIPTDAPTVVVAWSRPPRTQGSGNRPGNRQQADNAPGPAPEWDGRWSPAATVMTTVAVILALAGTAYFVRRVFIARRVRRLQGQEMSSGGPVVVGQVVDRL